MRINKYIAQSGIASRRKADQLIKDGQVIINSKVVREVGVDVSDEDVVEVSGRKILEKEDKVYYILNKPLDYITAVSDEQGRSTVVDLMPDVQERIFPVGRLDYNTTGLLIMTNDGEFSYRVAHPKHKIYKTYLVRILKHLSPAKVAKLRNGVDIGGFITSPAKVEIVKEIPTGTIVEISICEGKNRQIRKMFKAVGNPVQELKRTAIGEIRLGRLKEGHYRRMRKEEIEYLKNC